MADPTITVTNLGDQGVDTVFGLIYPPQVALVGLGTIRERPWATDGMVGARPILRATLAGDHRATDGRTGARFLDHPRPSTATPGGAMTELSPSELILTTLAQVAPEADLAALGPDADLRLELDLDSMDFLNFVVGIDERTGIDIPERDYPQLSTLNRCVEYLTARITATPR